MRRLDFLIIIATILVIPLTSFGWTRTYGGEYEDRGYCIQLTPDSGYIFVGCWNDLHACLIKTDKWGDERWIQTYGNDTIFSEGYYVKVTPDSGYVFTGYMYILDDLDFEELWLVKTNQNGDTSWTRTYGSDQTDFGSCVDEIGDGGYVVLGKNFSQSYDCIWLLRTDEWGDTLWTRSLCGGGEGSHTGNCIQHTIDGGFVMCGTFGVIKTGSVGQQVWSYDPGGSSNYVEQTEDGSYVVTGSKDNGVFLLKLNQEGDSIWMHRWAESNWGRNGRCVHEIKDGGYIIVGNMAYSSFSYLYLMETDSLGDSLWSQVYGGDDDIGYHVRQTDDGGFIIVGDTRTLSSVGGLDIWLLKTNEYGDTVWYEGEPRRIINPQEGDTIAYMIPSAWFKNSGTYPISDFYCHCEIASSNFLTPDYYVKYWVSYEIEPGDSVLVRFSEWASDDSATYTARFYTSKESEVLWQTREKTVTFYGEPWLGVVEEQHLVLTPCWELTSSCGAQITLRYSNYPDGFAADVFDASGRKVDKLESADVSGIITWGTCYGAGVYFIRAAGDQTPKTKRIVLIP